MTIMYKCGDCPFWGSFDEVVIERESENHPFGASTVEEVLIYYYCPHCHSEDVTEWSRAG